MDLPFVADLVRVSRPRIADVRAVGASPARVLVWSLEEVSPGTQGVAGPEEARSGTHRLWSRKCGKLDYCSRMSR